MGSTRGLPQERFHRVASTDPPAKRLPQTKSSTGFRRLPQTLPQASTDEILRNHPQASTDPSTNPSTSLHRRASTTVRPQEGFHTKASTHPSADLSTSFHRRASTEGVPQKGFHMRASTKGLPHEGFHMRASKDPSTGGLLPEDFHRFPQASTDSSSGFHGRA